jgi:hypothetical protein
MKLIPVGNGGPDISSYDHFSCGLGSDDLGRFIRVPFFLSHCVRIIACARISVYDTQPVAGPSAQRAVFEK